MTTELTFPAIRQLVGCYWMQNAELAYGSLEQAARAFFEYEPPNLVNRLELELNELNRLGYIAERLSFNSKEYSFWAELGGERITSESKKILDHLIRVRPIPKRTF